MDLFIIRHAWAGRPGDPNWPDDSQRPLTEAGRKRFAQVVGKLARYGFAPEVIATSPMVRCRETADIVAEGVESRPKVVELDELLPGGDLEELMVWTARQSRKHQQIGWVGHAPDVVILTARLVGGADSQIRFSKGSVAAIRFDGPPSVGAGELRWLVTAKILGV